MTPPPRKTSATLCVSTVLAALLLCLLNGEHYAAQLESAWPAARPLAEIMGRLSAWSRLPALHEACKETVDACCAALWSTGDGAEGGPAPELAELPRPEPPEPGPGEPTAFCGLHGDWLGMDEAPTAVFCGFHHQWLGTDDAPTCNFCGFHEEWIGREAAEKLVDTCPVTCRVLLMGDSLMEDFGMHFYRHLKQRRGLKMILLAKFSTGLCRPDYFNWFELVPRTMDDKAPHIVIFLIGANDGQPIWYSRQHSVQTSPADAWQAAYGDRVGLLLTDAEKRQVLPMWVGMPVMGGKYAALLARTEEATRHACERRGVPYVDTRALTSDAEGNYQSFITNAAGQMVRIRRKDKQHMTPEGNRLLIDAAMPTFEQLLRQHRLNHPELCRYPEEQRKLSNPSLDVVIPYNPK